MPTLALNQEQPIKVLVAKPGLDGHDLGAKLVCRALVDNGMEVVYSGLRQSPGAIARAAAEEDVDVVGLSMLSGAHLPLCARVAAELRAAGVTEALYIVGGNIPRDDHGPLRELGVDAVFATGTPFAEIVDFIRARVKR